MKRLLSHFGESCSEESQSAVLELLEKVTRLNRQLELREGQARKGDMDMDQVPTRPPSNPLDHTQHKPS